MLHRYIPLAIGSVLQLTDDRDLRPLQTVDLASRELVVHRAPKSSLLFLRRYTMN